MMYEPYKWYNAQKGKAIEKERQREEKKGLNLPLSHQFQAHLIRHFFNQALLRFLLPMTMIASSSLGLPGSCMFWAQSTSTSLTTSVPLPLSDSPPATLMFFSLKISSSFWPRSLSFALHSEWNSLLPEPFPKKAPNPSFQSQCKYQLFCLTTLAKETSSSHHPSVVYHPTWLLQFYI